MSLKKETMISIRILEVGSKNTYERVPLNILFRQLNADVYSSLSRTLDEPNSRPYITVKQYIKTLLKHIIFFDKALEKEVNFVIISSQKQLNSNVTMIY